MSLWQRSVPYLEQPAIGFVTVTGPFGENIESDVAALDAGGQFPLDLEPITDWGDGDRNFFLLDFHGDACGSRGLGCKE